MTNPHEQNSRMEEIRIIAGLQAGFSGILHLFQNSFDNDLRQIALEALIKKSILPHLPNYVTGVSLDENEVISRPEEQISQINENFRQIWDFERINTYGRSLSDKYKMKWPFNVS